MLAIKKFESFLEILQMLKSRNSAEKMMPVFTQFVRKIWNNLSVSFNVTHVAFCFFLFPWFLSSNKVISNLTIQVPHLRWAYFLYVTEVVIYLFLSFITGYETFNNWHFARSVLNHFVSTISFIGLHTIIALGLHGLKKSKSILSWETLLSSMVEMSYSHLVCFLESFE